MDCNQEAAEQQVQKTSRINVARLFAARLLFFLHASLVIWRTTRRCKEPLLNLFWIPVSLSFLEAAGRVVCCKAVESHIFVTSIFLYLISTVPPIWLLQLRLNDIPSPLCSHLVEPPPMNSSSENDTLVSIIKLGMGTVVVPSITLQFWVTICEQTLLVVIILGRWIMPRGGMTMDHLTSLLFTWIGVGADTVDFYDILKEPAIKGNAWLTFAILSVWTFSLMHYPLQLAGKPNDVKEPTLIFSYTVQTDLLLDNDESNNKAVYIHQKVSSAKRLCTNVEFWSMLLSMLWLDLPFLTMRLYCLIALQLTTYTMVFFVCKNTLLVLVQGYRLYGTIKESRKTVLQQNKRYEEVEKMAHDKEPMHDLDKRLSIVEVAIETEKIVDDIDKYEIITESNVEMKETVDEKQKETVEEDKKETVVEEQKETVEEEKKEDTVDKKQKEAVEEDKKETVNDIDKQVTTTEVDLEKENLMDGAEKYVTTPEIDSENESEV